MKANDIVTFKNPIAEDFDKNGKLVSFKVIEMRGERVLVESLNDTYAIKPTCVYLVADLVVLS